MIPGSLALYVTKNTKSSHVTKIRKKCLNTDDLANYQMFASVTSPLHKICQ